MRFYPEGKLFETSENLEMISSQAQLEYCRRNSTILEAVAYICDKEHNLHVKLPCMNAIIPRSEGALGIDNGTTRDIALISRVNKPVCFTVSHFTTDTNGNPLAVLSRKNAQQLCMNNYVSKLENGRIINARVTHLEQFGAFVDIGCGIPSLIPIDVISISRIGHPSDRFIVGQDVKVIVKGWNEGKLWLSHKELLGTWSENASQFSMGETVTGIIRSIEDYGIFVELTPNLAGLAEVRPNTKIGQSVSVYIKSIIPEKMKIKLIIVETFDKTLEKVPIKYFIESGQITNWVYSTENSIKQISTEF
ncbi:MAG: S1 RNA-binding domain-containing protein [Oscillospiraceae bacterium]|nr:S1 RNA-binding domain-containing protein [Oscillospiraceae bacterium]